MSDRRPRRHGVNAEERVIVPLPGASVAAGGKLKLTVRPEKTELGATAPAGDGCRLRGTVTEVVYLGTSATFAVITTTGADMIIFQQTSASAEVVAGRGDSVWLSWHRQHRYPVLADRFQEDGQQ
jgi:spermidine/putrescine transport system ATP-binding protein